MVSRGEGEEGATRAQPEVTRAEEGEKKERLRRATVSRSRSFFSPSSTSVDSLKAIPQRSMQPLIKGGFNMLTPSSSKTSADPHLLDTLRLPCLATLAPHAAQSTAAAVLKLTVWWPSPPVPTMSSSFGSPFSPSSANTRGCGTFVAWSRITSTNEATSCHVSPLARRRTRNAANWYGWTAPLQACWMASAISSAVRSCRSTSFSMSGASENEAAAIVSTR